MQIPSRFTIAVHILSCIDYYKDKYRITSEFIASSVNVNPVIIRKILQQLKTAGMVKVSRGSGGATLEKELEDITLLDIYKAVGCNEDKNLFRFHENPNPKCTVGRCIHSALDDKLDSIQNAMEMEMEKITMADVRKNIEE